MPHTETSPPSSFTALLPRNAHVFTMRLPPPPPNDTSAVTLFAGLPTIFTVLGKLGLELKREEAILPVYTVERIERPAAN